MDTQTTEHMYTNRGEKRLLNTLFSSCKSIPSVWSLSQELKVFWKLGWLKLGFFHGFLCHLGQYIQVCSRGWKQANRSYSVLWACGHEPAPIWDPYAQMSPCWQISSASGVSRYYLVSLTPPEVTAPVVSWIGTDAHPCLGHSRSHFHILVDAYLWWGWG